MRRRKGEVRRKILEELQKGPKSFAELREAIGCADKVVYYNLKKLEGEGLVEAKEVRGERKWDLSSSFWERKVREEIETVSNFPMSLGLSAFPPSFLFSKNPKKDLRLHAEFQMAILSVLRLQLEEKLARWEEEEVKKALEFAAGCFFLWRADFPELLRERGWVALFALGLLEGAGGILREEEWEGLAEYAKLSLARILMDMLQEAGAETLLKEVPRDQELLRAWMEERKEAFRKLLREIKEIRFCLVGGFGFFEEWPFGFTLSRDVEDFLKVLRDPEIRWDSAKVVLFALREYARRAAEELERDPGAKLPEVRDNITLRAFIFAFGQGFAPQEWPEMLEKHYPRARLPSWWRMLERLLTEALSRIPLDREVSSLLEQHFSTVYSK